MINTNSEIEEFDPIFQTIQHTGFEYVDDNDNLPEDTLKSTWEDEVHRLLKSRYQIDTKIRMWLAISTQLLIYLWMAAVIVILLNNRCYNLSDEVLMTILGTTTATVLGLAWIVLKGFFSVMKQDVELRDKPNYP